MVAEHKVSTLHCFCPETLPLLIINSSFFFWDYYKKPMDYNEYCFPNLVSE